MAYKQKKSWNLAPLPTTDDFFADIKKDYKKYKKQGGSLSLEEYALIRKR